MATSEDLLRTLWLESEGSIGILEHVRGHEWEACQQFFQTKEIPAGEVIVREGDTTSSMYVVLAGEAEVVRNHVRLRPMVAGEHFGELGLLTGEPRAATVKARTPMVVAEMKEEQWLAMAASHSHWVLAMVRCIVQSLRSRITDVTDNLELLLRDRFLPRQSEVRVKINGGERWVKTGTPLSEILPKTSDGKPIVAALLHAKPVSLHTVVTSDVRVSPLTMEHWEGFRLYRLSLGLLLLEAAHRMEPPLQCHLGPSMGFAQLVGWDHDDARSPESLAQELQAQMEQLVKENRRFLAERWPVDAAIALLRRQGWDYGAMSLESRREGFVTLVTCGDIYAPSSAPFLPDTSYLQRFSLSLQRGHMLLYFGEPGGLQTVQFEALSHLKMQQLQQPRHNYLTIKSTQEAESEHQQWLKALGVRSIGEFNQYCVQGNVSQLIQVSEGFHEKRISQLADAIAERSETRFVIIAGPSSSGKTTFIQRLVVQLRVNGIVPHSLSLDDYYIDREKTPRTPDGDYDFEALEAINLSLWHDHLSRLLAGEQVATARYDFVTGCNHHNGGPTFQLLEKNVLLIEGLHGLNPAILPAETHPEQIYKIFINPMTAMPLDRLNRVHVSDIRLLRRIVRDRHHRDIHAADNILRWPSVRAGERKHIYPFLEQADVTFNSSLVYELSVLKVFADRYLMEVNREHPAFTTAFRLRQLIEHVVTIYPDHVPQTSLLREFIGGSGFDS
ncbi:MAG: cyclic nucleotide-binding domain-containing protein [Deltaproteobacteria bacterium]|nr:MAG: cyclic nucleotide-binding domain-containing protein [Deltaproteobacteria bacterium]